MKTYKLANNIMGWLVFAIAITTYLLTIEPTGSFWDCGEFIVSAYKLEVGHPPGAPFFMLTGNLFSQLASDPSQVGMMLNVMSAACSALTILFLFWTITHLARRLIVREPKKGISLWQTISILGAGAVGALAFTFSDTFWFSAVEGEVYAYSSFMTAIVFWLVLKWEDVADEPHSNRWLILIAYVMGLSIGVHLLNLLCIPAIVLVFYFRKYENPTLKGALLSLLISFGIVAAILYGIIQGIMEVSGWFELLFVNTLGMPYNTGVFVYIIIVFGVLGWAIWESMRNKPDAMRIKISFLLSVILLGIPFIGDSLWLGLLIIAIAAIAFYRYKRVNAPVLNMILLCLLVVTIGYSSYATIMIRATADTPMNQSSPKDVFTLRDYLAREQYGETPLFYGATFASRNAQVEYEQGRPIYSRVVKKDASEKDRYFVSGHKRSAKYPDKYSMLFPRMHSSDERHINAYGEWAGSRVKRTNPNGEVIYIQPSFGDNLKFFFSYQVNYMYWRYFMWNFSGRQNDVQGQGEVSKGNWITGIKFLDEARLGPQDDQPDFTTQNKGRNKYYMLPLLLGLLGIFFQVYSGKTGTQQFWVVFLLFFMTGLAILLYLNQSPLQVRERDYAYAGSFYTFCIWIGLGVLAIVSALKKYLKAPPVVAASVGSALALLIPVQMASQNWDDHDRSGRYLMRDFGYNYLATCEPNAIIFTYGDNDTFPLWYNQEVEGFRTDVRVCNMSYLNADWYIDQMKLEAYESQPLPISWTKDDYVGFSTVSYVDSDPNAPPMSAKDALNWVKSDNPATKRRYGSTTLDIIPTERIYIPIDSAAIAESGLVDSTRFKYLNQPMWIDLSNQFVDDRGEKRGKKTYMLLNELIMTDMFKNNSDWSRPFYFAATVGPEQQMRLDNYLRNDGIANRLMPYPVAQVESIDVDILYDNLMNKYRWGNLEQPGLYIDENAQKMPRSFRNLFAQLATRLIEAGDTVRAKEVADRCLEVIPEYNIPYDIAGIPSLGHVYMEIGEPERGLELYTKLIESTLRSLNWYTRLNDSQYMTVLDDVHRDIVYTTRMFLPFFHSYDKEKYEQYALEAESYVMRYEQMTSRARMR